MFAINAKNAAGFSKKEIEELTDLAKVHHAKGLAWLKVTKSGVESPIAKFFSSGVQKKLLKALDAKNNDLLLFVADQEKVVHNSLGNIRKFLGKKLGLIDEKKNNFLWVTDFPLFEEKEIEGSLAPSHHMFTAPKEEDVAKLDTDPHSVRSYQHDLVLNGYEIGGGSIRIHNPLLQAKIFDLIGFSKQQKEDFKHLLTAFTYGVPPHGGIACGLDRFLMILQNEPSIREVIAFPKTGEGRDLMMNAPSEVDEEQLKELGIKVTKKE